MCEVILDHILVFSFKYFSGVLDDTHVFELSRKITTDAQLMSLGMKGLKLDKTIIEAALYRHPKDIQDAAHDVLSEWVKQQENIDNNYNILVHGLIRCGMSQLAAELRQLVKGAEDRGTTLIDSEWSSFSLSRK